MLIVVSPAKTLDYDSEHLRVRSTKAGFLNKSAELIEVLREKEPWQLSDLMGISDDLAVLNANRYQQWKLPLPRKKARPAIYAFKGDVYTGLDAYSLKEEDITFAQQHLRILSGLYGVLRPLDLILPYRLEMGTKLRVGEDSNLYQFWGAQLTEAIQKDLQRAKTSTLINLASNEYFKSVQTKQLKADIVTPVFLDRKGDEYKIISFWAKKARGLMARFIIENQLKQVNQLECFNGEGYYFSGERSDYGRGGDQLVFLREH